MHATRLYGKELHIPRPVGSQNLRLFFRDEVARHLTGYRFQTPIRFAIVETSEDEYRCELGIMEHSSSSSVSIFDFRKRDRENTDAFIAVMLVPTGIGAEIGGHAGDATPVARLLATVCDTLVTHPNVVNASDINELPENGLYVEGSVITRLLMGVIGLQKTRANRVLLVMDKHHDSRISDLTINAVSAARAVGGFNYPFVVELDPSVKLVAEYSASGTAAGRVENMAGLCKTLARYRTEFDAVALATKIDVPDEFHMGYFEASGDMVNPWGGVEALLTHAVSILFNVPSAHAPMVDSLEILNMAYGLVEPRMSAEAVSNCFIHCVLKGLHKSPRIISDPVIINQPGVISAADVSCLVIPDGCLGLPTLAALEQGIPVIAVRENRNLVNNDLTALPFGGGKLFVVDNYLEAVGVMAALKGGVSVPAVRRPIPPTRVTKVEVI